MSHELRTPLNAIIGFSEIMAEEREGALGNPAYGHYARDILDSSRHLAALIGDVIEFARVEQAGLKLYDQPIDAVELLEVCVKMCRQDARCKNIAIALLAEVSGVEVVGDVTRLRQVLVNLLSNAVKFTPPEGHVEARLSRSAEGDLEFRITDTGIGMERHQLKRIFEPFVQGDAGIARRFGGIGLGLPIARKLARLHGGDVTIEFEVRRRDGCHVRGAGVTGQASPIKIARAGQSLGGDAHEHCRCRHASGRAALPRAAVPPRGGGP